MARKCPYQNCDYEQLSNEDRFCPKCEKPIYFMGGHDFTELIAERTRDFTGRDWAFAKIDAWLAHPDGSRVFFLGGGPGSGKSAVAARLVQVARGDVPAGTYPHLAQTDLAYYHFCQARYDAVVEPVGFVKSLSLALADHYPAFAEALTQIGQRHPEIHVQQTVGQATASEITAVKIGTLEVGGLSARMAFPHLVAGPLQTLVQRGGCGTILILVDALDEALSFDPDDNIVTLLAAVTDDPRDLPSQVRFLVTGRLDPRVIDLIGKPALDLVEDASDRRHDVQEYAERRLAPVLAETAACRGLAERIATAGAGNFLYARYVLDDFVRHPADPAQLTLPKGLDDIYAAFLKREVGRQGRTWRTYRPLLGAMAMACGSGLTRRQLAGIMEERPSKVEELLEPCMQYLSGTFPDGPFRIYHQSFREFLLESQAHRLEPDEARQDIARYFWTQYVAFRDQGAFLDDYALAYLPVHLAEAGRMEDLHTLLLNYGWLQAKVDQLGVNTVLADFALSQPAEDDPTRKLHSVLEQGAYVLAQAPDQLAPQLLGRLLNDQTREIKEFLEHAQQSQRRQWLRPLAASLLGPESDYFQSVDLDVGINNMVITPDARIAVTVSLWGNPKAWDLHTGQLLWEIEGGPEANAIALLPRDRFVIPEGNGTPSIYDFQTGKRLATFPMIGGDDTHCTHLAVSASGRWMAAAYTDHMISVWDLQNNATPRIISGHEASVLSVQITPDEERIVSGSVDGTLRVWRLQDGTPLMIIAFRGQTSVDHFAITQDGNTAIVAATESIFSSHPIRFYNLETGQETGRLDGHTMPIEALALSTSERLLASVDENGHIRLWDLKLMKCIREIEIDQWFHAQVAEFDKAESVLVIGGWHGLIVQGIDRSRCYTKPTSYRGSIDHLKWAPGLRLVISATDYLGEEKPMVRFWNSETLEEVPVKFMKLNDLGKRQDLLDIAATPDGKLLLVVFGEKWAEEDRSCVCAVWDLETGNLTKAFDDFLEQVYYVWLSADGRFIFGDLDSKLLVRKLPALSEKCALQRYSHYTSSVLVNRAGSIAVVRDRYAIEAWDLTRGRKLWEYRNKGMVTCACLTPDECWAVSGSDDHEIRAWELTNGMLLRTLRGHTARVNQMIAYDSGARVISVSSDRSIRLWDLADGSEMARFTCDTAVSSCTLVPSEGTAAPLIVAGDAFGRLHFLRLEECK